MGIHDDIYAYEGWNQWLAKQKNRFKRQLAKWKRCRRQITISSCDLKEINLKNKENLSRPQLVFSIELGQPFWIGKNIQVIVLGVSQGIIRLGIEAPPGIKLSKNTPQDKEALL